MVGPALRRISAFLRDRVNPIRQAQFADGTTFTLQAPEAFTQEQVVQMADQVTYNP